MTDIGIQSAPVDRLNRQALDRHDAWRLWLFAIFIPLAALFSAAGGLGLATIAALMSLGAILISGRRLLPHQQPGWPFLAFSISLAYTSLSLFWSSYDKPDQSLKLLLLTPLYVALPLFALRIRDISGPSIRTIYVGSVMAGLILMTFEAITGGAITQSYKIDVENYEAGRVLDDAVMRSLSRGAFGMLMMAGPMVVMVLSMMGRQGWYLAGPAILMMMIIASGFGVEANIGALILGVTVSVLAWFKPRTTLPALLYMGAAILLSAPLALPLLVHLSDTGIGAYLPYSWEWRLEIWATAGDYIWQKPLFGHGLDASRVIEPMTTMRGYEVSLLPLHPHNVALHIWLETGFVGAALWAATLILLALRTSTLKLTPARTAAICGIMMAWLFSVMVGFGIWQEWHHGALAIGLAGSAFIPRQ